MSMERVIGRVTRCECNGSGVERERKRKSAETHACCPPPARAEMDETATILPPFGSCCWLICLATACTT